MQLVSSLTEKGMHGLGEPWKINSTKMPLVAIMHLYRLDITRRLIFSSGKKNILRTSAASE